MNLDELAGLYAEEIAELGKQEPMTIVIMPLTAIAIAGHIQMARKQLLDEISPGEELSEMTELAIKVAKQFQNLFDKESITYQMLEAGWTETTSTTGSEEYERESFDNYIGEAKLDRFEDPEETRRTYLDD
jgi:hypothetical protein